MDINAYIEKKQKKSDFTEDLIKELKAFQKKKNYQTLSAQSIELGLILLNSVPELYEDERAYHHSSQHITENTKRLARILEITSPEMIWDAHQDLWLFLVGKEFTPYIKGACTLLSKLAYQTDGYRRSFTAPQRKGLHFLRQLNFIINLTSYTRHEFTLSEFALYSNHVSFYGLGVEYIWASAINEGNQEIYNLLLDITYNRYDTAKVSREIIKAMLLCDKTEAYEAVEKLLLAAQRQEGLRQTILECLDETNLEAMKRMIKLILDEKLTRFSSVVRALDVWVGLGWESQRESTVIRFTQLAYDFLTEPAKILPAVSSKDNAEVIMALWAQGVLDVDACVPLIEQLIATGEAEKTLLALYFVGLVNLPDITHKYATACLPHKDLAVLGKALDLSQNYNYDTVFANFSDNKWATFELLEARLKDIPAKEQTFEGKVFSWLNFSISKEKVYGLMISILDLKNPEESDKILVYFDLMGVDQRNRIAGAILPNRWENNVTAPTEYQRDFALRILKDRSSYIHGIAIDVLKLATITEKDIPVFTDMLGKKTGRESIIDLLLKLPIELLQFATEKLLKGSAEQRLAGLDLLTQMKVQKLGELAWVQEKVQKFAENPKLTAQEKIITDKLLDEAVDVLAYNTENGFGLFDPKNITLCELPPLPTAGEYAERVKANQFGLSQSPEAIHKALTALEKLITKHKNYEYEQEYWDKTKHIVLLGNGINLIKQDISGFTDQQKFENYPLHEVWEEWATDHKITPLDLMLLQLGGELSWKVEEEEENIKAELEEEEENTEETETSTIATVTVDNYAGLDIEWVKKINKIVAPFVFIPKISQKLHNYYWNHPILTVITALNYRFLYEHKKEFLEGLLTTIYHQIPADEVSALVMHKNYWGGEQHYTWRKNVIIDTVSIAHHALSADFDDATFTQFWKLCAWSYQTLPTEYNEKEEYKMSLEQTARAYSLGLVNQDEMMSRVMQQDAVRKLTAKPPKEGETDIRDKYPFLVEMMERGRNRILEIELKRGDTATPVTELAHGMNTLYGMLYLKQILIGIGKESLGNSGSRSHLLSINLPHKTDTQEAFNQEFTIFPEKRMAEVAVYVTAWIRFISHYLAWEKMDSAVWWLHAHTNSYHSAETETEIARYSKIEMQDFSDGAVDKAWFLDAYAALGAEKWQLLYDAAKYVAGTGHNRAKLYADIILGKISLEDVAKKVNDKRNQDYLRVYGLVALDAKNPDKDVLQRYQYLQKFKKESKQFGAQRQESEGLAVRISMDNLARTAGFSDPMRLTWAMETEEAIDIINRAKALNFNTVTVQLVIDEDGKSDILVEKAGKELKSIPADLKKEPAIIELKEFNTTLQNQYKRTRKSLEDAMIAGDAFSVAEIEKLMTHPVVSPMLQKLVLLSGGKLGFWQAGKLVSPSGESTLPTATVQIAHCTDLFAGKEWSSYQQHCFEKQIKQPFKQVFRELYIPTADELQETAVSRRYAGHQVQPQKTVALLKSQGWKVDYDEGLQKVFHKEGFIAKVYAMADWFTPSDVESPTLETVEFIDRETYKNIPFTELSPRIFSEVMRDVDLVVSVAHVGEVDPEASQSSIELRTAIVRETLRLFKITNVTLKGNHALIKGSHGEYSVHLGSAIAHKVASATLFILPVHSQHRGRMFLPFLDEDPRTAELMSKILLLAKDNEIQDPTILKQLL